MMDALHCLMSYVALVLPHDIALQKKRFRKSGAGFDSNLRSRVYLPYPSTALVINTRSRPPRWGLCSMPAAWTRLAVSGYPDKELANTFMWCKETLRKYGCCLENFVRRCFTAPLTIPLAVSALAGSPVARVCRVLNIEIKTPRSGSQFLLSRRLMQ